MRVLVVEDERELVRVLVRALTESGHMVDFAYDGEDGLNKAQGADYDAIVLDLTLPRLDGEQVLQRLRESRKTPVLVLTARDNIADKVRGLNLGADDYLTKPFNLEELLARLAALGRRWANQPAPVMAVGDVQIDTAARVVRKNGRILELTSKEYSILELLLLHRGSLVSRSMLYEHVYGENDDSLSNVVDVHISNLRRKVGARLIETRRGQGYFVRD